MDAATRQFVETRARGRCEYCRIPQTAVSARFYVEHIIAQQHLINDGPENLALSCDRCNFNKGPNLSSIDVDSSEIVVLFHPRRDTWQDHFVMHGAMIVGRTPAGRATVRLL